MCVIGYDSTDRGNKINYDIMSANETYRDDRFSTLDIVVSFVLDDDEMMELG